MPESTHRAAPTRDNRRLLLFGLAGAVLLGLLLWAHHWWTHPDLFGQHNGYVVRQGAEDLRPIHVALSDITADTEEQTVHIDDLVPNVARNGANADFDFVVCTPNSEHGPFTTGRNLTRYCGVVRPAEDADLHLGPAASTFDVLVLTITPRGSGVTRVESVDIDYSMGARQFWRRGSETIGPDVRLKVG